jgi:hypothetical protein
MILSYLLSPLMHLLQLWCIYLYVHDVNVDRSHCISRHAFVVAVLYTQAGQGVVSVCHRQMRELSQAALSRGLDVAMFVDRSIILMTRGQYSACKRSMVDFLPSSEHADLSQPSGQPG